MDLSVVPGPLETWRYEAILEQYNRLTSSRIPMTEFLRWVRDGVEGPAWHAVLENEKSQIVGHSAVIPLRGECNGKRIVAGKAEYAFILEDYQTAKIRRFEHSGKPRNAIMIQQLFQRWQEVGLGPLLISTSALRQRSLSGVGCAVAKFPVSECLLILRPRDAARKTPNLEKWQRISMNIGGILQAAVWRIALLAPHKSSGIRVVANGETIQFERSDQLCFFEDLDSLKWRYLEGQYERLDLGSGGDQ
jgi:hypothetical protein